VRSSGRSSLAFGSLRRSGIGAILLGTLIVACVVVPIVSAYDPNTTVDPPLQGVSSAHLLGTDELGRDVFVRVFSAGRLDIAIAVLGIGVSCAVGTLLGIAAAISRSRAVDWTLQRLVDALLAFPFVVFILSLFLVFGPSWSLGPLPAGAPATLVAIWCIGWTLYARLARAETLALLDTDFVVAARLLGYSKVRLVVRHLLPIVTRTTLTVAGGDALLVVGLVAALPFLGAGVQPPTAEWGAMMYEGRTYLAQAPLLVLAPAGAVLWFGVGLTVWVDKRLGAKAASAAETEPAAVDEVMPALEVSHG
jgi:peptide/nickel transport system permease protein